MNGLENVEESPVGTGARGLLFTGQRSWPTTPDPAPVLQYTLSTPQDDSIHMTPLQNFTNYLPDHCHPADTPQLPRNGHSEDPELCYAVIGATNATTGFLDVEDSSPNLPSDRQDHRDEAGLFPPDPLRFGPAFEGRDPSPIEGSALPPVLPYFKSILFAYTWTGSYSSEFGDHEEFPATTAIHGSTQDSSTATTPLGNMATTSSQALGLHTYSAVRLPDSPSNDHSLLDPHSTHDDATSQLATTAAVTLPPSPVEAHQNFKKYWCPYCPSTSPSGFVQKQGLTRHIKDKHMPWNSCPYCSDFEWSQGRRYLFDDHIRKIHPEQVQEAAPPTTL
ncbi:hypothetical protein BJY52DRAFT_1379277 [Lactarius psammicola]|nr:hypothetical protein BJY52DRAFT_1379277 [Lactarius psammicola]